MMKTLHLLVDTASCNVLLPARVPSPGGLHWLQGLPTRIRGQGSACCLYTWFVSKQAGAYCIEVFHPDSIHRAIKH